ncbi:uncharacterized protein Fot_17623 [Forsythia ovata]|uniref:Uncharacterized protein n=1 Tax=Forsythia ovata TaxID=205694 RepID=A0ABD1VFV9_9LAMI
MRSLKKIHFQFLLLLLNIFFPKIISQETPDKYGDSIRNVQPQFSVQNSSICFDIPDHVPNPCEECKKPDGNCGAGLRCICHPKECILGSRWLNSAEIWMILWGYPLGGSGDIS